MLFRDRLFKTDKINHITITIKHLTNFEKYFYFKSHKYLNKSITLWKNKLGNNMRTKIQNSFIISLILLLMSSFSLSAQTTKSSKKGESNVIHLTKEEFLTKVFNYEKNKEWNYTGNIPCILDFYANWCGPCRMISPYLDQLAEEYKGKIYIYKINVDQERELASVFGASSIPLLIFIPVNGSPLANRGALPKEEIKNAIDNVLLGNK
jgi:thioredoxin